MLCFRRTIFEWELAFDGTLRFYNLPGVSDLELNRRRKTGQVRILVLVRSACTGMIGADGLTFAEHRIERGQEIDRI